MPNYIVHVNQKVADKNVIVSMNVRVRAKDPVRAARKMSDAGMPDGTFPVNARRCSSKSRIAVGMRGKKVKMKAEEPKAA